METSDHKTTHQSGHEGHIGVHVCHKCGWPFPNPHPSARHRRAHKRVCGTIEGYKLDSSLDNTHLDGSDGENASDDDYKITSDRVIERTISRKSSSGVGSRSSRSTRSEDDVFADAVTEFADGSGSEVFSDCVMSRGNSFQNTAEHELEAPKLSVEKAIARKSIADDSSTSSIFCEDIPTFEGKSDEDKAGPPSQDQVSGSISNPALVSASVTRENGNAFDQNSLQSFGTSTGLGTDDEGCTEVAKIESLSELRTSCSGTIEESSEEFITYSETYNSAGGTVKLPGMHSPSLEGGDECLHIVDSPGNINPPLNSVTVNENASKSLAVVEDCDRKIEVNENADLLGRSNASPGQELPAIAVEDLDQNGGIFNISGTPEDHFVEKSMEDNQNMLKREPGQAEPVVKAGTVDTLDQISVPKALSGDNGGPKSEEVCEDIREEAWEDQEVSSAEERKSIISSGKDFSEVTTTNGSHEQETRAYGDSSVIPAVEDDGEHLVIHENDSSTVLVEEFSTASSKVAEHSVDGITPEVEELMNGSDVGDVGNVEDVSVSETMIGSEHDNVPLSAELVAATVIIAGSIDNADEPSKSEKTHEYSKLDKNLDSDNLVVIHSQPESELSPQGVREEQIGGETISGGNCMNEDDASPGVKSDDKFDSTLKTSEDAVSFSPKSTAAVGSCTEKFAEHASNVSESERTTEQHAAISTLEAQSDGHESESQSVSVLSATAIAASNSNQAPTESGAISLEPKVMEEAPHPENKASIEPLGVEEISISEIETSENQTALKTLLGEAIAKSRAESPNYDEIPAKDSKPETAKEEMGKEWNSPARYPVKIKTEKRRGKNRSFWMPFFCCSSVKANGP